MKNNSLIEEQLIKLPLGFYGPGKENQTQDFLLFIIRFEALRIEGINKKAENYLNFFKKELSQEDAFLEEIVHPEDYPRFLTYLKSFKTSDLNKWEKITIRLRNERGGWKEFLLEQRIYSVGTHQEKMLLTIVTEVDDFLISEENGSKGTSVAEKAFFESRNKYQLLLYSLDEAFCSIEMIFDIQGKPIDYLFLETNPAFEKHVKLVDAEGKTMRELEPHHEEYWFQTYGKVITTGKAIRFQDYAKKLDNQWFDLYAFPIGKEENKRVAVLFSNITERKNTMDELKELNEVLEQKVEHRTKKLLENSELLQTVFNTTNQGIVVYQPLYDKNNELHDFLYLRVNQVIIDQYRKEELEGHLFSEKNPDAIELGVFDGFKETIKTGVPFNKEIYYDRKEFNNWFRITGRRQNGLLISTVEDITLQKKEAQHLKETIKFKDQLAVTSPDIILIFDLYEEKIKYINRDVAPREGMRKSEMMNISLLEIIPFIHPREREKAILFHKDITKASDTDIVDIEFRVRSGKNKWEWFNALGKVFMRNHKSNVCEYMVLLRNINEQKQTHKALLNAEKLSIKGEVARTLAHELRNPLASISMASDILKSKMEKNDDAAQTETYLGIIKRSTKVLNKLVTDLLTSSNYSPMNFKKHCLATILEDTLKVADDRIYLSGIKVKKFYKGYYFINADEEKLKIALLNIIINASEAMDPNNGVLSIKIEKKQGEYMLIIKDNGCGLDKEQVDKLFDAFYTQKHGGIGVGLSSVKNILEEHDAKIEVTSKLKKGTSFHLFFQCFE